VPIDVDKVVGATLPGTSVEWTEDQVILYHLALGAGSSPTDPQELAYAYEANLKVLPTFGVVPALPMMTGIIGMDGLSFNPAKLLHGGQDIVLHRPLPAVAKVHNTGRVAAVYDKGSGALVVVETLTSLVSGEPLCTNRFSLFLRGEGGFGGDPGPASPPPTPDRAPDLEVRCPTLPQQALLYRLTGDKNPLHADPAFAAFAGFDRPILHGLCSFGIAGKVIVDHVLNGDVSRVREFGVRFAGVVFPGETLATSVWIEGDRACFRTQVVERDAPVLSEATLTFGRP
jgi:acyl dehydratase